MRSVSPATQQEARFTLTMYTKAVKRRAKLSGAYLAEYERALAWATLPRAELAATGSEAPSEVTREWDRLKELPSDLA